MIPGPFSDQFTYQSKPRASGDDPLPEDFGVAYQR